MHTSRDAYWQWFFLREIGASGQLLQQRRLHSRDAERAVAAAADLHQRQELRVRGNERKWTGNGKDKDDINKCINSDYIDNDDNNDNYDDDDNINNYISNDNIINNSDKNQG